MEAIPRLGQRIQRLRERRGLTVKELADRAGTTYQSIWRIERGEQLDPSIALIRGIARGLGVGVDYLIEMFTNDTDRVDVSRELDAVGAAILRNLATPLREHIRVQAD